MLMGMRSGAFGVVPAPTPDTTPDQFTFVDVTGATISTVYTSNTITVSGINASTAITITGGTYSINGAAYTSSAGSVVLGDTVSVRATSSGSNSTAVNVALTIGGVSDTYTVTTQAASGSSTADMLYAAGQSNSSAEGTSGTPSGFVSDANIKIWNNSAWETYAPGTNSMGNNGSGTQYWGSEVAYAMQWRLDNPAKTLYIVKHAVGGTGLGPASDPTWDSTVSGSLYSQLKTKSDAARAQLTGAGLTPNPLALFWSQGETPDSGNSTYASGYATKLAALFAKFRTDLIGSSAMILCSRFPLYLPLAGVYKKEILAAQVSCVAGSQPAAIVDTRVESGLPTDGYHYPSAQVLSIGQRAYGESLGSLGFVDKVDAALSATVTSETLTIRNIIGASLPVSVSGCTWSKNGGAYSSSAGTVTNADTVSIQATASASNFTATTPSITIGNATITKRILTVPAVGTGLDGSESDGTNIYNSETGFNIMEERNGVWGHSGYGSTLTPAMAVAPDGTVSASEIHVHHTSFDASFMVSTTGTYTPTSTNNFSNGATLSFYVKPGENGSERYLCAMMFTQDTSEILYLFIDTTTWTVSDTAANSTATTAGRSITSSSIADAKYGYKKVSISFSLTESVATSYTQFRMGIGMSKQATLAAATAAVMEGGIFPRGTSDGLKHLYVWRPKVTAPASGTNRLLLADGTSLALQTNATDKILLASIAGFTLIGGAVLTLLDGSTFSLIG